MIFLLFRLSGCLFSWLEERQSFSRSAIDAKKAQWKRELGTHTHTRTPPVCKLVSDFSQKHKVRKILQEL